MSSTEADAEPKGSSIVVPPEAIREVCGWLDLKMRTGRYALSFACELAWHMIARCYHVHMIYDEIGVLEGSDARPSRTRVAESFKRDPLIGYWKKHHFQPYFLAKNLESELKCTTICEESVSKYIGLPVEEIAGPLAYDVVFGSYKNRTDRRDITGERIVFEKLEDGSNYYITLGGHSKNGPSAYQILRNKIDHCKELDKRVGWISTCDQSRRMQGLS